MNTTIDERVGPFDPNRPAVQLSTGEVLTEGQLRGLKEDPRYWNQADGDRDYRAWVDQLYEVTYNQPAAPASRQRSLLGRGR